MGPKRVHSYMSRSGLCSSVNIKTLAGEFKARTGKPAVLVVDGNNFMYHVLNSGNSCRQVDWLMGGQLKELADRITSFVEQFKKTNIDLVFFFDGASMPEQKGRWLKRRSEKLEQIAKIYRQLQLQSRIGQAADMEELWVLPPLMGATARFIVKYVSGAKAVYVTCKDPKQDAVAFAKENDCIGILSEDTSFVVLGDGKYMSLKDLQTSTLQTRLYDGHKLASHLGIKFEQLPLFATLAGGDFLSADALGSYHRRKTNIPAHRFPPADKVFKAIAAFVRATPVGKELLDLLPTIAKTELRDVSLLTGLRQSVEYYCAEVTGAEGKGAGELKPKEQSGEPKQKERSGEPKPQEQSAEWQRIVKVAREKHVHCEIPYHFLTVMTENRLDFGTTLDDLVGKDLPPAEECYRNLRSKIYGILLHEKPGDEQLVVEDWNLFNKVQAVGENIDHPGLEALWSDNSTLDDTRWQLFTSSVSSRLDADVVRTLGARYIVPTCVLVYLRHQGAKLTAGEEKAFLLTAAELDTMDANQLRALSSVECVPSRAVKVANLFTQGVTVMHMLLAACGFNLEEYMPWKFFDGKLFLRNWELTEDKAFSGKLDLPHAKVLDYEGMLTIVKGHSTAAGSLLKTSRMKKNPSCD